MQLINSQRLYSATDLVNFIECEHLTALDLAALQSNELRASKVTAAVKVDVA